MTMMRSNASEGWSFQSSVRGGPSARNRSSAQGRAGAAGLIETLEQRALLSDQPFASGDTIVEIQTNFGNIWLEMFDKDTPLNVANFLNYVTNDRYDGTFFHRHAKSSGKEFVLQGGGYKLDSIGTPQHITTFDTVKNEFKRSNLERTVAMAKLGADAPGGGPDSATSEFFFNLGDNAGNLDTQNGGFTVFAQVVKGWDVVLKILALDTIDADGSSGETFNDLPVKDEFPGGELRNQDLVLINDVVTVSSPGWSQEANGGAAVRGAGDSTGQSVFVTVNELGRPIAFYQSAKGAAYTVTDLSIMTSSGSLTVTGQVSAWFDSKDSLFYAAAPSTSGLLLFKRGSDGYWTMRNLTTELSGAEKIGSDIAVFKTTDNYQFVAGLNGAGEVVVYQQTSKTATGGNFPWAFANLSTRDLETQGLTTPRFVGNLVPYVTSWNGLNLAGLDDTGDVQTVWWAPGLTKWQTSNLTTITGAPKLTGGLTAYVTSYDAVNIVGADISGNVVATWWLPSFGGDWVKTDLTTSFSFPKLQANSLSSFVTPWDATNVAGLDESGNLQVYWWAPGNAGNWNILNLTTYVTGSIPIVGKVTGVTSAFGTISLVGADSTGKVARYFWNTTDGGTWSIDNLTEKANFFS